MGFFSRKKAPQLKTIPTGMFFDWLTDKPQWTDFDPKTAIVEGYQQNPWVYRCVKIKSDAAASIPLAVEVRRGDDWEQVSPDHRLQALLDRPHPDFDRSEIIRLFVAWAELTGDAYLVKVRAGTKPAELFPMSPVSVSPIPGKDRVIKAYKRVDTNTIFPTEDIVHLSYTNPNCLYFGQSPLRACGKSVDVDNGAADFQKISMQNRGVLDGIISVDQDLTSEQWEDATEFVRNNVNRKNARGTVVLSKAKYQQLSQSMVDMDFQGGRDAAMRQICSAFGVPEAMITGMDSSNLASAKEVRKSFWQDTMIPGVMSQIEAAFNLSVVPEFGDPRTLRVRFDYTNVEALRQDLNEKLAAAERLFRLGYPINQINQKLELGMDDIESGDTGYIPSGMIPAGFDFEADLTDAADAREAYDDTDGQE